MFAIAEPLAFAAEGSRAGLLVADGIGAGLRAIRAADGLNRLVNTLNEAADNKAETDHSVNGLTAGLPNETDKRDRPVKGQFINGSGDPQKDLDALPGTTGANGQKTLPDGSTAVSVRLVPS